MLISVISKDYQLKSVKVTLRNSHLSLTPPEQRRRIPAVIGQHLRYVRSELFLRWIQEYRTFLYVLITNIDTNLRSWYRVPKKPVTKRIQLISGIRQNPCAFLCYETNVSGRD